MTKIVVMGGSFNPPTIAHQRLLLDAVNALGADKGIFVPSSHAYVKTKMKRAKHPEETLVEYQRLKMLSAMCEDDPRLCVDDLEFHRKGKGYTYETMLEVQEKYPDATLCFLAGGDKVDIFLLGGVRFKYQPVASGRTLEEDLKIGMERCDAVVVTGAGTGISTELDKIKAFRAILGDFPLIVGAGMTAETAAEQLFYSDGAIVGSYFKEGGYTEYPVDEMRVKTFMTAANTAF